MKSSQPLPAEESDHVREKLMPFLRSRACSHFLTRTDGAFDVVKGN